MTPAQVKLIQALQDIASDMSRSGFWAEDAETVREAAAELETLYKEAKREAVEALKEAERELGVEDDGRAVRLDHLLGVYRVGSRDWSWYDEYADLIHRPVTRQLLAAVRRDGIAEPILLGTDGRVWDGHHRITVAMHLGLDSVPVEFAGASSLATRETVTEEMVERMREVLRAQFGIYPSITQATFVLEAALTEGKTR